ncbi:MAG: 2'-5' RNA ligase family protein [Bacteroidota bacterium]|nr:2'-5' RNA ligase family protein [Bacteroidota bacterium]
MQHTAPLIVTLALDEHSFLYFNALRQQYFPPAINYLAAHLTLFHHLPANEPAVFDDLETWCRAYAPFSLQVTGVRSIGKGVAFTIESPTLLALHKTMQVKWQQWLKPQDKQKLWPHITVQNKVSPQVAKETLQTLQASFQPFAPKALGFQLWTYLGGPWEAIKSYPFQKP